MARTVLYRSSEILGDAPEGLDDLDLYLSVGQRAACEKCRAGDKGAREVKIAQHTVGGRPPFRLEYWRLKAGYELERTESARGKPEIRVWIPVQEWVRLRRIALAQKLAREEITPDQFRRGMEQADQVASGDRPVRAPGR